MNMRGAWTSAVRSALATMLVANIAWGQSGAPPMQPPMVPGAYAQAMVPPGYYAAATGQAPSTVVMPTAAYPPAAMYPQPIAPAGYMNASMPMTQPQMMPAQMSAQMPMGPMPDAYGAYGYAPASYAGPEMGAPGYGGPPGYSMPGAMPGGMPGAMPGGYGPPDMGGMPGYGGADYGAGGYGGDPGYGGQNGACQYCGGQGCDMCGGIFGHHGHHGDGTWLPNGLLGDIFGCIAPYPDGGCAAVRWFDFAVDYLALKRDNTGRSQPFTSLGTTGPIVLATNNLDFGSYKPGFRFSAAYQVGPANSIEFTYFGTNNYTASAAVRSATGNLFSTFSQFGLVPFPGAAEFDNANFQQIVYQSSFDSFEVNWRNRWMAPNCRYQGSWTLGIREFLLDEKFQYFSSSNLGGFTGPASFIPARGISQVRTTNDLTGLQVGTDLWVCLLPGLRVGGEFQAGVYGNHAGMNNTLSTNLIPPGTKGHMLKEFESDTQVAFLSQANLLATYRLNYQWTLRTGYQFLFVDGVALAPENFNPVPIGTNNLFRPHVKSINVNGDVFYHGWNVGLEYMW
jgi:hypothetical protein